MSSQSERFTRSARRALALAQGEASHRNKAEIGTAHLLLALLQIDQSIAMQVLRSLDVVRGQLVRAVLRAVEPVETPPGGSLTLAPETERVIQAAVEEARRTQSCRVGTGHLLLGLAQQEESVAAQCLRGVGVDLNRMRIRAASLNAEPGAENE